MGGGQRETASVVFPSWPIFTNARGTTRPLRTRQGVLRETKIALHPSPSVPCILSTSYSNFHQILVSNPTTDPHSPEDRPALHSTHSINMWLILVNPLVTKVSTICKCKQCHFSFLSSWVFFSHLTRWKNYSLGRCTEASHLTKAREHSVTVAGWLAPEKAPRVWSNPQKDLTDSQHKAQLTRTDEILFLSSTAGIM